jgi:hypothetical protein
MITSFPTPEPRSRRIVRVAAPVGVVALAFGGSFAIAQAATAGSGAHSAHDAVERPTAATALGPDDHVVTAGSGDNAADANAIVTPVNLSNGATQTFRAGAAGFVTVSRNGNTLTVVATAPNAGFTTEIESSAGPEVEVEFRGLNTRVDFEAELEDGGVVVKVRERALANDEVDANPNEAQHEIEHENEAENENEVENEVEHQNEGVDDHSGSSSVNRGPGSINSGAGTVTSNAGNVSSGPGSSGSETSGGSDDSGHAGSGSLDNGPGTTGSSNRGPTNSGSGSSGSGAPRARVPVTAAAERPAKSDQKRKLCSDPARLA